MKITNMNFSKLTKMRFGLTFLLLNIIFAASIFAQTTEFTYQGKLSDAGMSSGNYDFEFRLCATLAGDCSAPLASDFQTNIPVSSSGIFTTKINFGYGFFNGADRFLEIRVRRSGETTYTTLTPRQKITSAPYAFQSYNTAYFNNMPLEDFILEGDPRLSPNNYVNNTTTTQTGVNFNIGGTGTAAILNAATQFNLGGERILGGAAGTDNLFAGRNSGASNAGSSNSFFGTNSGRLNTGNNGSFFGAGAGEINTGASNSFFGGFAGSLNTSGRLNSFFGSGAGGFNTQGDRNAFFGVSAGALNTTGGNNTFFGYNAGTSNATGANNTLIGKDANVGASNLLFASAIGAGAFVTQSNSLVLGSINGVNGATSNTNVGIGTTAPAFKLQIIDPANTGLRVQTNTTGGTVGSFGGNGAFQVDTTSVAGGRFTVLENGNVGIGNNAPTAKLEVNDAGNTGLRVRTNTTGGTVASFAANGAFQVDATNVAGGRFNILQNGNVGIGDASPNAKLSVNGNGTSSTALEINNGAIKVTGAGFNTQTAVFKIEKNATNTCGQGRRTVIDNPYSNNDPNAIVFVTPVSLDPLGTEITYNIYYATSVGTGCESHLNKWVIVSDQFVETITVRFNVMIIKP